MREPWVLRLDSDRRLTRQFRGPAITSDAGLLAYRELDDALHLTSTAADTLVDTCTGKNGRHRLAGLLRQALFGVAVCPTLIAAIASGYMAARLKGITRQSPIEGDTQNEADIRTGRRGSEGSH